MPKKRNTFSGLNGIAARIKNLRLAQGLTQKAIGAVVDVSEGAVRSWEDGRVEPPLGTLELLASKLDCNFRWLLLGEEDQSQAQKKVDPPEFSPEQQRAIEAMKVLLKHGNKTHETLIKLVVENADNIQIEAGFLDTAKKRLSA